MLTQYYSKRKYYKISSNKNLLQQYLIIYKFNANELDDLYI